MSTYKTIFWERQGAFDAGEFVDPHKQATPVPEIPDGFSEAGWIADVEAAATRVTLPDGREFPATVIARVGTTTVEAQTSSRFIT